jgi:hypothetical protein
MRWLPYPQCLPYRNNKLIFDSDCFPTGNRSASLAGLLMLRRSAGYARPSFAVTTSKKPKPVKLTSSPA